jgi:hypothetical protein
MVRDPWIAERKKQGGTDRDQDQRSRSIRRYRGKKCFEFGRRSSETEELMISPPTPASQAREEKPARLTSIPDVPIVSPCSVAPHHHMPSSHQLRIPTPTSQLPTFDSQLPTPKFNSQLPTPKFNSQVSTRIDPTKQRPNFEYPMSKGTRKNKPRRVKPPLSPVRTRGLVIGSDRMTVLL